MICCVDYGVGNIGSILNMIKSLGHDAVVSSTPEIIKKADKIILPGVGSFDHGMIKLEEFKLVELLKDMALEKETPILGICLGMQLLATNSEEGSKSGLNLIQGTVKKFDETKVRIPHVGWNYISAKRESPILNLIDDASRFYFTHSYYFSPSETEQIIATTVYGIEFASIVGNNHNIFGAQFHPEKSHKFGKEILRNFIERIL